MPNDESLGFARDKCRIKEGIRAVFLDRDGVLNEKLEGWYVTKWEEFKWLPGAIEGIKLLNDRKIPVYLISNQSGIGRGHMTMKDLEAVHKKMSEELEAKGAHIDDIFVCPHAPDENCGCRKPKPGLLFQAKKKHPEIDFTGSLFIGDSGTDEEAAKGAGVRFYLIKKGESLKEILLNEI